MSDLHVLTTKDLSFRSFAASGFTGRDERHRPGQSRAADDRARDARIRWQQGQSLAKAWHLAIEALHEAAETRARPHGRVRAT
jgi:hypothetical protein